MMLTTPGQKLQMPSSLDGRPGLVPTSHGSTLDPKSVKKILRQHNIEYFKNMYLILRMPGCFFSSTWPLASSAKSSLVLMIASQSLTISLGEQKP